jgi:hypothetical protein
LPFCQIEGLGRIAQSFARYGATNLFERAMGPLDLALDCRELR